MYLIVGKKSALLIDLSNRLTMDNAVESLRKLVYDRIGDKQLYITITHNHGDHTGMMEAFRDDERALFWIPAADFSRGGNFPEGRTEKFAEGASIDLGGKVLNTITIPGHTVGSTLYFLEGSPVCFTGDAIGSGHGVWIFNQDAFYNYVSAVPHLIAWIKNPEHKVNPYELRIYGGHYWQRDWFPELEGEEFGMDYLCDMQELLNNMEKGIAESTPSGLDHPVLDTYFRYGTAIVVWNAEQAEQYRNIYPETFVYRDEDIVIRQIDEHTWVGNGHLVYNESVYLIEGEERANMTVEKLIEKDYAYVAEGNV